MGEVIISVKNVSKDFRLPHEKASSIKNIFTHALGYIRKRRSYEVQHALHDISFEVKKGEFFGIVGRNGSGKSTLLKMLAGIYQPTNGVLYVSGKLVPFIELGVGFNPELTGRENVYLNGALLGFSKKQIDLMYQEIVAFAELENFMDQRLKNYSSGMQVRLAFSMAIRAKADILLIDEVLAVGDADFQRKCFEYFQRIKGSDTTVVFVTHSMDAIREYCDKAILIDKNRLVLSGTAFQVANEYTKMFTENTKHNEKDSTAKSRWGDGSITYSHVAVEQGKLTPGTNLIIKARARALCDVSSPVFGFLVKNGAKTHIMGTNTQILGKKVGALKAGDTISLAWEVPNIFNDGLHYIDPAIVYKGGSATADWWEEAASFTVVRESRTPYIVSPDVSLDITISHETN